MGREPLSQVGHSHSLVLAPLPGAPTRGSQGRPACWARSRGSFGVGALSPGQAPRHLAGSGPVTGLTQRLG